MFVRSRKIVSSVIISRLSSGLTIALNYSIVTYRYVTPPNRYIQRYAIGVRFILLQITMSKNIDTCQFGLRWMNLAFLYRSMRYFYHTDVPSETKSYPPFSYHASHVPGSCLADSRVSHPLV